MNIKYCGNTCPIGMKASDKCLNDNNSAYDAAIDFMYFTEKCFATCPYKDAHKDEK